MHLKCNNHNRKANFIFISLNKNAFCLFESQIKFKIKLYLNYAH